MDGLCEAVAWRDEGFATPALRSDDLRPPRPLVGEGAPATEAELIDTVRHVLEARGTILLEEYITLVGPPYRGRLVAFFPGVAEAPDKAAWLSKGFVDLEGVPAWDTWVAVVKTADAGGEAPYLVAWLPEDLAEEVATVVDASTDGRLRWFDTLHPEICAMVLFSADGTGMFAP